MRKIKTQIIFLRTCVIILAFFLFIAMYGYLSKGDYVYSIIILFDVALLSTAAVFLIRQNKYLSLAHLIKENQIFHKPVIKFSGETEEEIEVYLSGFGILLDDRVIPFNVAKERLQKIDVYKDVIFVAYGTPENTKYIYIPHKSFSEEKLKLFAEKLYFETGITPNLKTETALKK